MDAIGRRDGGAGAPSLRGRVPAVLDAWEYVRDNVLHGGLVDPGLKRLCFRFLADDPETMDVDGFAHRELARRHVGDSGRSRSG